MRKKKTPEERKASRKAAQARYQARSCRNIGAKHYLIKSEANYLLSVKKAKGLTWLQILYRGLGLRREDVLSAISQVNAKNEQD